MKRTIPIEIKLTPKEIAQGFSDLCEDGQAEFFNELAAITSKWNSPFCFQLQAVTDSEILTDEGRKIMATIGKYSLK